MPETFDKIKQLAKRIFGFPKQSAIEGRDTGLQRPVTTELELLDKTAIRDDRLSKIKDCIKMAKTDPRIARMLKKLSADSVVGGFTVNVEGASNDGEKEQAQERINKIQKDCEILRKTEGWVKALLREGDLFWELVVDDKIKEITRLKKLATSITFNNMNAEGNFPEDKSAYYQEHPLTRQEIRTFEEWQVVQLSWEYEDGQPYGSPIFAPARLSWERLDSGEKNVVVRRVTRAGKDRLHKIGTADKPASWTEVEEYKRRNRDTFENPLDPIQDYFSNGLVDIEDLQGDTQLGEMDDILHFETLLFMVAGIPSALIGRDKDVNRDVLEEQEEDYYRVIENVNETFEYGLRKVFDFGLLLAGINNEAITYSFNWGAKDRDDIDAKIDRAEKLQKLGFSFETVFNTCDLDKVMFEDEMERIQKQVDEGIVPYGISQILSPAIAQLLMGLSSQQGQPNEKLVEQVQLLREVVEKELTTSDKIVTITEMRKQLQK